MMCTIDIWVNHSYNVYWIITCSIIDGMYGLQKINFIYGLVITIVLDFQNKAVSCKDTLEP